MNTANQSEHDALKKNTIVLRVRYAPVKKPYVDPDAELTMTLAEVKATVLEQFQLTEGAVEGGAKTYQLSYEDIVQSNLGITLNELDTYGKQLDLLLVEQFIQG